jgi:RHS repeat-associated protein
MVFTSNGTYYLRSRHNVSGLWSSAKSGSVTIYTTPSAPGAATVSYANGQTTMTRPAPPSGHTYYWQSSSSGTSTSNSSSTMVFTTNGNYFLRSRHNVSGLWSSAKSGSVTIYTTPSAPGAATASYANGQTTMTRPTSPSGFTYYWQSSSTGTSTSNSSSTMVFTTNGTYYLRSRHNVSGLWSSAKSGSVTIYTTPSAPGAPTTSYANGQTTMTRPTSPSGFTYYWQSSSTGTSTSNSSSTMVFTTNGTYYLRSRHNVSGLWSSAKSGSVSVCYSPSKPVTPLIKFKSIGTSITMPSSPTGVSFYWQTSADGTSVEDSQIEKVFTSSTTIYLRPRNDAPSYLWGEAINVDIPIQTVVKYSNENYVSSIVIKKDSVKDAAEIDVLAKEYKSEQIKYMDGLGRLMQVVNVWSTPNGYDQIHQVYYDSFGRERFKYLPLTKISNDGSYNHVAKSEIIDFYTESHPSHQHYVASSTAPYAETVFENSPLNRVLQQGAPGGVWQPGNPDTDHTVRYSHETNALGEVCLLYVEGDILIYGKTIEGSFYASYPRKQLYKTVVKDENWTSNMGKLHTTEEFKNKQGLVVLKRTYVLQNEDDTVNVDTYYAYDDFGLLRYVLPPEASKLLPPNPTIPEIYRKTHSAIIKPWSYFYKYDGLKRMIEKQNPGAESVYMVYDLWDRLSASQDGEMRSRGEWLFTKYDAYNRPVMTGIVDNDITYQGIMQNAVNDFYNYAQSKFFEERGSAVHGYTNQSFPSLTTEDSYLTVTYYDDYNWLGDVYIDQYFMDLKNQFSSHDFDNESVPTITCSDKVKGQVTGSKTKVLDDSNTWMETVTFYDDRYRPILTRNHNYVGGEDISLSYYDFSGKVLESWVCHKTNLESPGNRIIRQVNAYDHAGRLLSTGQQMTDATNMVTIVKNTYNELGQLQKKEVGNSVQEMNYAYNIRGWLTHINNPDESIGSSSKNKFAMRLSYNNPVTSLMNERQYNGNISAIEWRSANGGDVLASKRGYGYSYDALNRLENAYYGEGDLLMRNTGFDDVISGYDLNGNILGLNRNKLISNNPVNIDKLVYSYTGNQLKAVTDYAPDTHKAEGFYDVSSTIDYNYDLNGNLTFDGNKGISQIEYNHLNLPKKIVDQNNSSITIEYIYDAKGQKLAKISSDNLTTLYAGSFVYQETLESENVHTRLKYILHPEGMVDMASAQYQFYLKDHLGNTRVVVDSDNTTQQITNYYPFGLTSESYLGGLDNKYLYNGKELQEDKIGTGMLDWYDYGARMYDPALGRWHAVDILAEKYYSISPYTYVANIPLKFIDPDGMRLDGYTVDRENVRVKRVDDTGGESYDVLYPRVDYDRAKESGKTNLYGNPEPSKRVVVSDLELLPQLESRSNTAFWNGTSYGYSHEYGWGANTTNRNDAYNVFKFVADNTNVEWSYQRYTDGTCAVVTAGQDALTLTGLHMKSNKGKTIAADVHSHPFSYEKDLVPSGRDEDRADYHRKINPNAKFQLYVPNHPDPSKKMQIIK